MNIRTLVFAAAIGLGPAALFVPTAMAQPVWDVVHVNLPYSVQLGNKTLTPGDYTIQQLHSDNSTVLLFYNGNGMKFETSAMTIPALEGFNFTQDKTQVVLHHVGSDYYFDKIWIQGKDYGYEFPLPAAVKAREKEMSKLSVPAQASTTTTTENSTVTTTDNNSIDNNANAVAANTDTTTTTNTDTTANASDNNSNITAPPPVTDATSSTTSTDVAQATTTTDNSQPAMTDNSQSMESSANREKRSTDDTNNMPATSAGWLAMMLSGGTLSGVGMMLRRKR